MIVIPDWCEPCFEYGHSGYLLANRGLLESTTHPAIRLSTRGLPSSVASLVLIVGFGAHVVEKNPRAVDSNQAPVSVTSSVRFANRS